MKFGQKKKDKQRSTKHTLKTKDRVTRTPLKTGGELRCSGSSCTTSGIRCYENICNIYFSKPHKNLSMPVFNICISKPQKNIVAPGSCFHSAQNSIMRILLIRTDILFS